MKRLLLSVLAITTAGFAFSQCSDLFFSEYVEGSGQNNGLEIYNPTRRIFGRGWPRTVQIDNRTLGTLFYDLDANQAGGPGLFFVRTPVTALEQDEN